MPSPPSLPADTVREPAVTLRMRLAHRIARHLSLPRQQLRNARPIVSFTFDDVPDSATTTGARLLEQHGWRGTYYIATSLFGQRTRNWTLAEAERVRSLAAAGHEIALHTHRHVPVIHLDATAFRDDLNQSLAILRELVPDQPLRNFAYPYGFGSLVHRAMLGRRLRSSRTTHPGLNAGRVDPHMLRSAVLDHALRDAAEVERLIDEAVRRNAWLIFTTHDITDSPSDFGCTPDLFARTLAAVARRDIEVTTVDRALDLAGVAPP